MVELEDFKYGGTNITAFRLLDPNDELVQVGVDDNDDVDDVDDVDVDRHHICQKIYATAILGLKNLRKKSGICDKTSSGQNNVNALK